MLLYINTNFVQIERQTDTAHKLQDMHLFRIEHGVAHFRIQAKVHIWRYVPLPYQVLMKSSNIPCVTIRKIRTLSNDSEIRTFARRNLNIPKDTYYLNMIYSTMIGVRYMHFCQQERAYNYAIFYIKYAHSKNLQLCTFSYRHSKTASYRIV